MRILLSGIILILVSCNFEKFPGYTTAGDGIHYRLIRFAKDNGRMPGDSDIVTYQMKIFDGADKLLFSSYEHFPKGITCMLQDAGNGMLGAKGLLGMMQEGDSVSFIIEQPSLALSDEVRDLMMKSALRLDLKLMKVLTPEEYQDQIKQFRETGDVEEHIRIAAFLTANKLNVDSLGNGMYMQMIKSAAGSRPVRGNHIRIRYKGMFLEGEHFDGGEMEFIWGDQMQVIKGLELALARMTQGSQAKIIIPSYLAYGEKGSSNGVIPPLTPVVYEVEVLELK